MAACCCHFVSVSFSVRALELFVGHVLSAVLMGTLNEVAEYCPSHRMRLCHDYGDRQVRVIVGSLRWKTCRNAGCTLMYVGT